MNAKELRIGNYVDRTDYICKVTEIKEDGIFTEPLSYKGERLVKQILQPIPLTKEWLLKLGFKQKNDIEFYEYIKDYFIVENEYTDKGVWDFVTDDNGMIVEIKYVHQLQNLYFALTEKEL